VRHLLLLAHVFGFVLWIGGGLAAMSVGLAMRPGTPPRDLGALAGIQGRLYRGLILPGTLLTVLSGLVLTLRLYGGAVSATGFPVELMIMQGAGLLGAGLVLGMSLPAISRLVRLDPAGEQAPLFAALQGRTRLAGMLTGLLALTALVAGVLMR